MKLTYSVEDDYGVVSAGVDVKRDRSAEKKADPEKAWAQPGSLEGSAPAAGAAAGDHLAPAASFEKEAQTYIDFGAASLCGARSDPDARGQGRRRQHRAFQADEAGAAAAASSRSRWRGPSSSSAPSCWMIRATPLVMRALEALTLEPEGFIDDTSVYLGLRTALRRARARYLARRA